VLFAIYANAPVNNNKSSEAVGHICSRFESVRAGGLLTDVTNKVYKALNTKIMV
jgi:hypothetical protein